MNTLRTVLAACMVFILSMGLAAQGQKPAEGGATAGGKTQIVFMTPLSGADGSYMDKIIQSFNEQNPDVEVTHLVVGASSEYKQKLSTSIATKTAPEVLFIRKFDMPLYLDYFTGFTREELKAAGIDPDDIYPNLLSGLERDGKILGIPLDVWIFYMAYNKENFRKAGLDPEKPPYTREEFVKALEALRKVTPEGVTPYYENFNWAWIWCHLLWQFGGELLTPDFKAPAFQKAGAEVLHFLLDLQAKGLIPSGTIDPGPAFESGESSVLITGIWTINPWKDLLGENFGYAVAPQLGNTKAVFGGSHVIALVDVMIQDPKKRDAAMRWVKFLWDHALDWYAAGQTPARISIAEGKELKERLPHIWTVAQQVKYVRTFQMFPYVSEMLDDIAMYLEAALFTKELTPEEAMAKAAEAAQTRIDDYWATR